jgi:Icc-related predicted phosphoesterase
MANHLRILAVADLHGLNFGKVAYAIDELRPDWIVVVGDVLPDYPRISGHLSRLEAQRESWRVFGRCFARDGAKTTVVGGGHETGGFAAPQFRRLPEGLEGHVVRLEGVGSNLQGTDGRRDEGALERELRSQLRIAPEPWIYISRLPPHGCLDRLMDGEHVGHRPLARHLEERGWPRATLVICGHVHDGFGCAERDQTLIVNAKGGLAVLEWDPDGSRILDLERI